jgi:hypothetical protein
LDKKNHGDHEEKEEKVLWKKGSASLTTRLIPAVPAYSVTIQDRDFVNSCNSRKRIAKTGRFSLGLRRQGRYIEVEGLELR